MLALTVTVESGDISSHFLGKEIDLHRTFECIGRDPLDGPHTSVASPCDTQTWTGGDKSKSSQTVKVIISSNKY